MSVPHVKTSPSRSSELRHPLPLGTYSFTSTIHRIVETTHLSLKSAQYETASERGNVFLNEELIKIIFWGLWWRMSWGTSLQREIRTARVSRELIAKNSMVLCRVSVTGTRAVA